MKDKKSDGILFPTPLLPTNMKGVFSVPPLPDDLDLTTADDIVLLNHGILVPRPKSDDHPARKAAWKMISGRKWHNIAPELKPLDPRLKRSIRPTQKLTPQKRGSSGSPPAGLTEPGFTGCTLLPSGNTRWTNVFATWNCPILSPPPQGLPPGNEPILASWVGLDAGQDSSGNNVNEEMFQAGFFHYLNTSTNPNSTVTQSPWWMWFPPSPTGDPYESGIPIAGQFNNFPVNTGDEVFVFLLYLFWLTPGASAPVGAIHPGSIATIQPGPAQVYLGPDYANMQLHRSGWLNIRNLTNSSSTTLAIGAPAGALCPGASIEWMIENVHWSNPQNGVLPVMPKFAPFIFQSVGAGNPLVGGIPINMQDTTISGNPIVTNVTLGTYSVAVEYV